MQPILVYIIFTSALVYVGFRLYVSLRKKDDACACSGCPSHSANKRFILHKPSGK